MRIHGLVRRGGTPVAGTAVAVFSVDLGGRHRPIESIREALPLYLIVAKLLGRRPVELAHDDSEGPSWADIEGRADAFANALVNAPRSLCNYGPPEELAATLGWPRGRPGWPRATPPGAPLHRMKYM